MIGPAVTFEWDEEDTSPVPPPAPQLEAPDNPHPLELQCQETHLSLVNPTHLPWVSPCPSTWDRRTTLSDYGTANSRRNYPKSEVSLKRMSIQPPDAVKGLEWYWLPQSTTQNGCKPNRVLPQDVFDENSLHLSTLFENEEIEPDVDKNCRNYRRLGKCEICGRILCKCVVEN